MGPNPRKPSGPAVIAPHHQAGHKTAPDQIAAPTKILATREPSTQDSTLSVAGAILGNGLAVFPLSVDANYLISLEFQVHVIWGRK